MTPIREHLDRAADDGRSVSLWWRDDDAVAPTSRLDRLLALARMRGAPVAIAAVPGEASAALADRLADEAGVDVLVHGWRHRNHEPTGAKTAEFGPARGTDALAADAAAALDGARRIFGHRALPVFVPPWNRLAPDGPAILSRCGFSGLSVSGPRRPAALPIVNTHLDPVDWRGGRGPVAPERLADALAAALRSGEPVGLLTHHLSADEAIWTAIERLLDAFAGHPAIRWTRAGSLWPARPSLNRGRFDDLTWAGDARDGSSA